MTRVIERAPRLLLCDDVRAEVNAAKRRLEEIAPSCDAKKAISEYPEEIITRIQLYDEYSDLPVSLQNIIAETSDDDENEAADAYDARWNDWERESSGGDGDGLVSNPGRRGLDENSWDNQYASPDSAEWMIDGYWETEESESDGGGGGGRGAGGDSVRVRRDIHGRRRRRSTGRQTSSRRRRSRRRTRVSESR